MRVIVRTFGLRSRYLKPDADATEAELPSGSTLADLLRVLEIPAEEVSLAVVNGSHVSEGRILQDGDHVKLFAPVGGG